MLKTLLQKRPRDSIIFSHKSLSQLSDSRLHNFLVKQHTKNEEELDFESIFLLK